MTKELFFHFLFVKRPFRLELVVGPPLLELVHLPWIVSVQTKVNRFGAEQYIIQCRRSRVWFRLLLAQISLTGHSSTRVAPVVGKHCRTPRICCCSRSRARNRREAIVPLALATLREILVLASRLVAGLEWSGSDSPGAQGLLVPGDMCSRGCSRLPKDLVGSRSNSGVAMMFSQIVGKTVGEFKPVQTLAGGLLADVADAMLTKESIVLRRHGAEFSNRAIFAVVRC
jgi:hypothetical protein